ncbi:MAG: hypothetical protein WBA12_00130 [Catalinimonas sp.]
MFILLLFGILSFKAPEAFSDTAVAPPDSVGFLLPAQQLSPSEERAVIKSIQRDRIMLGINMVLFGGQQFSPNDALNILDTLNAGAYDINIEGKSDSTFGKLIISRKKSD